MHWGISIDIYPIYYSPKSRIGQKIYKKLFALSVGHLKYSFYNYKASELKKVFHNRMGVFYTNILSILSNINENSGLLFETGYKVFFDKNVLFPTKPIEFEGILFAAPNQISSYLTSLYGDYMTPPPEDKRKGHSTAIVDADMPYEEYIHKILEGKKD